MPSQLCLACVPGPNHCLLRDPKLELASSHPAALSPLDILLASVPFRISFRLYGFSTLLSRLACLVQISGLSLCIPLMRKTRVHTHTKNRSNYSWSHLCVFTQQTNRTLILQGPEFVLFRNTISMLLLWFPHTAYICVECGDAPQPSLLSVPTFLLKSVQNVTRPAGRQL